MTRLLLNRISASAAPPINTIINAAINMAIGHRPRRARADRSLTIAATTGLVTMGEVTMGESAAEDSASHAISSAIIKSIAVLNRSDGVFCRQRITTVSSSGLICGLWRRGDGAGRFICAHKTLPRTVLVTFVSSPVNGRSPPVSISYRITPND
jgi:hypothetical protein